MDITEDYDDVELSFAQTTFGDDTDTDEGAAVSRPRSTTACSSPDHEEPKDHGYYSSERRRENRQRRRGSPADLSTPLSLGGSPMLQHCLSPRIASSPRVRSRPRGRSRGDSRGKRDAAKGADTSCSAVVVRKMTGVSGESAELEKRLRTAFPGNAIERVVHTDGDDFAFVTMASPEVADAVVTHCHGLKLDTGGTLTAKRCKAVTPGQDPEDYERYGELSDTLVLKNLPFSIDERELKQAITAVPGSGTPADVVARRNASGTFSGMAFVRYHSVQDAGSACRSLDGIEITGRQVRVEYKRGIAMQTKRTGSLSEKATPSSLISSYGVRRGERSPPEACREEQSQSLRDIEARLSDFASSAGDVINFPPSLSSSLRKHVHTIAAAHGLDHTSERHPESGQRYVRVSKLATPGSSLGLSEGAVYATQTPVSIRNAIPHTRGSRSFSVSMSGSSRSLWRRGTGETPSSFRRHDGDHMMMTLPGTSLDARDTIRPRANTHTGAPLRKISKPVEVTRPPKGPDGTRGFRDRG